MELYFWFLVVLSVAGVVSVGYCLYFLGKITAFKEFKANGWIKDELLNECENLRKPVEVHEQKYGFDFGYLSASLGHPREELFGHPDALRGYDARTTVSKLPLA